MQREVIDLSGMDDSVEIDEDDIMVLDAPPVHMKKWSNATDPIDIDENDGTVLRRFTPEENERRRRLMMDHDVENRKKRKASNEPEGSRKRKAAHVEPQAGPSAAPEADIPAPEPPTLDTLLTRIMAIIPDICPIYASNEIQNLINAGEARVAVEAVLTKAFDTGYPKPTKQAAEPGADEQYLGKVFRAEKRRGEWYQIKCIGALEEAFPAMPVAL